MTIRSKKFACLILFALSALLLAGPVDAQLATSGSSTGSVNFAIGTLAQNVSHTVPVRANRLLLVAVHMNITDSTAATIASVTYGGDPLFLGQAINDGSDDTRTELWVLVAPPTGTANVVVTAQGLAGADVVPAVISAVNIIDANQTLTGSLAFSSIGNDTTPTSTLAGTTTGDMVVDFMSARQSGTLTAATGAGQTQIYNLSSPAPLTTADVLAAASYEFSTGAAVTMSYTLNASRRWSKLGGSFRAATTDVKISGYATPDLLDGSPTNVTFTFTITAQSNGANNVNFSDTLPAGLTIVSATASQGTCTAAATTNCSLGTLLNAGSSATVTIVATTTNGGVATVYNNSGTISSGTTDVNAGNNSATVTLRTQSKLCANPGKDGAGGTITGSVNSYFPGTASAAAGATSITVGAGTGTTPIAIGDLLLIIQMQDATIDFNNDDRYGDGAGTGGTGTAGSGVSNLNSAGRYEYVVSRSAATIAAGGVINITASGVGSGLIYGYTNANATGTHGARRFQVVRVPQYTTATFSPGTTATAWNGSVGGVFAVDVAGTATMGSNAGTGTVATTNGSDVVTGTGTSFLTQVRSGDSITIATEGTRTVRFVTSNTSLVLSGAATTTGTGRTFTVPNITLSSMGFRGGGGRQLAGGGGADTDYRTLAATATNASKGEGIAGTPRYLFANSATLTDTTIDGYPSGSSGRGAPGNAGGGGTDGNPVANDQNPGGGGGGNAGAGGQGGNAWSSADPTGGFGGTFDAPNTTRIIMGGGGGAGTTNNGTSTGTTAFGAGVNSSGAAGGGIVLIRANALNGTGTISSNGGYGLDVLNDAAGGGGAGGTIIISTQYGTLTGLTVTARGGDGGDAWIVQAAGVYPGERHGPGGGGGGGAIYLSSTAGSTNVAGGTNGLTTTALDNFGAGPGLPGLVAFPLSVIAGADATFSCALADLVVTNVGTPTPVQAGNNVTYTQSVTNNGPSAADQTVFTTAIPASASFQSMVVPAGWTCITPAVGASGIISCTIATLASGASANFSVVVQSHIGTPAGYILSDTANATSQTTESNYANNKATATTPVVIPGVVDLGVAITAPATVVANNNISYTQTVTNGSPTTAASSVTFTETIPANATFQSLAVPAGWSCVTPAVNATGTVTCTNPSLAAGASASFPLVVKVNAGTAIGTVITETATVSTTSTDANPLNNSSTATTTVVGTGTADLAATITTLTSPVAPGDLVSFTETVRNNGVTSSNATFTQTVPANTTFVSMTVPAGWSCTLPAVGAAAGTSIPCTSTALTTTGSSFTFTPVFQVVTGTPTGTTITQNVAVATTGGVTDSIASNNTASATSTVNATSSADLAITKGDSPDPVGQGQLVTYLLTVVNNGPEIATGVTVTDTLPATVSFVSASPSAGSCSGTTTITCSLGTMAVRGSATISVVVQANATGALSNTATVTGTKPDPVAGNNSATATTTVLAVTLVRLREFTVTQDKSNVLLEWETSFESDNLGFNVYRQIGSERVRINNKLIAGTALTTKKHDSKAGNVYRVRDKVVGGALVQYWLEDVDLRGFRTMHGPVLPVGGNASAAPNATPLPGLGASGSVLTSPAGYGVVRVADTTTPGAAEFRQQSDLAAGEALKIFTTQEGWYRLTRASMIAAGYDPGTESRSISLYTGGIEQPLLVDDGGDGRFDTSDAVEFFATNLDTTSTGARTYWLRKEKGKPGERVESSNVRGNDPFVGPVAFTQERKERSLYFAALTNNGDQENFFGSLISSYPVEETINIGALDTSYRGDATLELTIQGGTDRMQHRIAVSLGGRSIGTAVLNNQEQKTFTFGVPQSWLAQGANLLALQAMNGDDDISLMVSSRITYQHLLMADSGAFEADVPSDRSITVGGFRSKGIRAIDVTDPLNPIELSVIVGSNAGMYSAAFTAVDPGGNNGNDGLDGGGLDVIGLEPVSNLRTVLVFDSTRVLAPAELSPNRVSTLTTSKGSDLVIISNSAFLTAASTLKPVREREGLATAVVDVEDIYDEYNFGIRSAQAIRYYLSDSTRFKTAPRYVLLVGDASFDPRAYLELGAYDFVPTKIVATSLLKTASDDWFTDFNNDGIGDIATGRIPVRTAEQAARIFGRLTSRGTPSGPWSSSVLMVADAPGDYDFASVASSLTSMLPASFTSRTIAIGTSSSPAAEIVSGMNEGSLIVDYIGHASTEMWSTGVFQSGDASTLSNGNRLPFVVAMNCLNGYFHDLYTESLAEALITAPNGGAIAVWASSTLTQPDQQAIMNRALYRELFGAARVTLGDATKRAKVSASDPDVRKSWILFGDPSMPLK